MGLRYDLFASLTLPCNSDLVDSQGLKPRNWHRRQIPGCEGSLNFEQLGDGLLTLTTLQFLHACQKLATKLLFTHEKLDAEDTATKAQVDSYDVIEG